MSDPNPIKIKLLSICEQYVAERISTALKAMDAAQSSANEESKNSSGDKYETGRAMMHLEKENISKQLAEARKLEDTLNTVKKSPLSSSIGLGSIVETSQGNFFIAISIGKVSVAEHDYFVVSADSPLGAAMIGNKANEQMVYNSRIFKIHKIS
jgi:transcription elongation GreA/GreB family factor